MKLAGNNNIVNDSGDVFSLLEGNLKEIENIRVVNKTNKKQVARVLYKIQSMKDKYSELKCPLFSKNLKLFSLTHEDILAEDSPIQINVYLHPTDSDNNFRLRIEFDRNWKNEGLDFSDKSLRDNFLDIKKRMLFDINKVRKVAFEYEGFVGDYNNGDSYHDDSFRLEFQKIPNMLCYYDKNGKELKRYGKGELQCSNCLGDVEDYRSVIPWYDFKWSEYNQIHESDKWLYKGNPEQVQKIFADAVDSTKISAKTTNLRNFLNS